MLFTTATDLPALLARMSDFPFSRLVSDLVIYLSRKAFILKGKCKARHIRQWRLSTKLVLLITATDLPVPLARTSDFPFSR